MVANGPSLAHVQLRCPAEGSPYGQALGGFYWKAAVQWISGSARPYRKVFRYQQATSNRPLTP